MTDPELAQAEVLAFLRDPAAHGGVAPEEVRTHSARIFLSGDRAVKLKRAVRYDYLDFSTPERRRAVLERELALNRAMAPTIYDRVAAVTRGPDGGPGDRRRRARLLRLPRPRPGRDPGGVPLSPALGNPGRRPAALRGPGDDRARLTPRRSAAFV